MSYSVFSAMGSYVDSGTFSVYAGTSPDRLDELTDVDIATLRIHETALAVTTRL